MAFQIIVKFPAPDSLLAQLGFGGIAGPALPNHLAAAGHMLTHLSQKELLSLKSSDSNEPTIIISAPEQGKAGISIAWTGLTNPLEQLVVIGHFMLAKAQALWNTPPAKPIVLPPGGLHGVFGKG